MMHAKHRERLRERYLKTGPDGFNSHELLELLLFYALPRINTNDIAHKLLDQFGSLEKVLTATTIELRQVPGIGEHSAILISLIKPLAHRSESIQIKNPQLNTIEKAAQYCVQLFRGVRTEQLRLICLDAQFRVTYSNIMQSGIVDEVPIYTRQVVQTALLHDASSIILTHNHPGQTPRPSLQDINATRELLSALQPLGISLCDHIIVAGEKYYSFMEAGPLKGRLEKIALSAAESGDPGVHDG